MLNVGLWAPARRPVCQIANLIGPGGTKRAARGPMLKPTRTGVKLRKDSDSSEPRWLLAQVAAAAAPARAM